jgi:hypothetical protein
MLLWLDSSATDAAILHNANNEKASFALSCCFGCDSLMRPFSTMKAVIKNQF